MVGHTGRQDRDTVRIGNEARNTDTKEHIMSNKNPYELRFDLLTFSRDTLESQYHAQLNAALESIRLGKTAELPTFPTRKEIFELAEEYRNFIEKKV